MRGLLDVNMLIALLDMEHPLSDRAHGWLSDCPNGIATCPIVENGAVRVMAQASYAQGADPFSPTHLLAMLARMRQTAKDLVFLPEAISLVDETRFNRNAMHGPKQLTDIYLLGLAVAHDVTLVTFNRNIPLSAVRNATPAHLTVL
jgi:uncharacterized protein